MILGPGSLKIRARNAKFAADKLIHQFSYSGHQLNPQASWLLAMTAAKDGQNVLSAGIECDPLLSKAGSFIRSRGALTTLAHGWNLGLEGYNTVIGITEAHREKALPQFFLRRYDLGDGYAFNPLLNLQYSYHSGKGSYTTLDSSIIHRGSFNFFQKFYFYKNRI